jgi:hypothetical protein
MNMDRISSILSKGKTIQTEHVVLYVLFDDYTDFVEAILQIDSSDGPISISKNYLYVEYKIKDKNILVAYTSTFRLVFNGKGLDIYDGLFELLLPQQYTIQDCNGCALKNDAMLKSTDVDDLDYYIQPVDLVLKDEHFSYYRLNEEKVRYSIWMSEDTLYTHSYKGKHFLVRGYGKTKGIREI